MYNLKKARTLKDMVYGLEPLAYYFEISPREFWSSPYREIYLYCEIQFIRTIEDFKQEITLQEAVTDKILQGDSMRKKPKIVPLRKIFKDLFKKNKNL